MGEARETGVFFNEAFRAGELGKKGGGTEGEAGVLEKCTTVYEICGVHNLSFGWLFPKG